MENHPIPQDITGFEFKLIGDMTIKQFAYIAGGVILAWIFYSLPLFELIKIPLAVFFLAFGAALAFLPVSGRPLDTMISNFFKAVFSPTQYLYTKTDTPATSSTSSVAGVSSPSLADLSKQQFANFLGGLKAAKKNKLDEKEKVFFQQVTTYSSQAPQPLPKPVEPHSFAHKAVDQKTPQTEIKPEVTIKPDDEALKNEALILEKELSDAKVKEQQETSANSKQYLDAHQKVLELQQNLSNTLLQKQELEKQLMELQKQVEAS